MSLRTQRIGSMLRIIFVMCLLMLFAPFVRAYNACAKQMKEELKIADDLCK